MPNFALHLPQPCQERWAAMTPTAAGRHCAACAKTVVDFTTYTDAELAAYLSQHSQLPCGRFRESQLGRVLLPAAVPVVGWRRWLGGIAALLGLGSLATPARAQGSPGRPAATQMQGGASQPLSQTPLPQLDTSQHSRPASAARKPERILSGAPLRRPLPPRKARP